MRREPMRPHVDLPLPVAPEEALLRLRAYLHSHPSLELRSGGSHLMVRFQPAHRSFWTPWLDAHLRSAESGCRLVGRLTPHPAIWTGYMAGYSFLGLIGLLAFSYGIGQLMLGHSALAMWALPAVALLTLTLYFSAFFGQRLAEAEMRTLREAVTHAFSTPTVSNG